MGILLHSSRDSSILSSFIFSKVPVHHSMQHEEGKGRIEICVLLQSHNLIVITVDMLIRWDSSHDWNAVVDGYALFGKDKQGKALELLFM